MTQRHPLQPLGSDDKGLLRFKPNKIVQFLLNRGGFDMNKLAGMSFSNEDREQFAQLIGYSFGGFSELSYVSSSAIDAAARMHTAGETETEARLAVANELITNMRNGLREPIAALFNIHPDDLKGE